MVEQEIALTIEKFYSALRKNGFFPVAIYLFGSQANGTASEKSDIDIMVVLPKQLKWIDPRFGEVELLAYKTDPRIEAWFAGEKEFNELHTPIISTVRESGQLIKAA